MQPLAYYYPLGTVRRHHPLAEPELLRILPGQHELPFSAGGHAERGPQHDRVFLDLLPSLHRARDGAHPQVHPLFMSELYLALVAGDSADTPGDPSGPCHSMA